jgi:hypothetical protein
MSGVIPPLPNTPSWRGAQLKHRDNFTFTFYDRQMDGQTLVNYYIEIFSCIVLDLYVTVLLLVCFS